MAERTLTLLTCNIQAGSRTASYGDYITRGWSNVLPAGKRSTLDAFAHMITSYDLVGLQESDPGSLRSGFMNQTHYLAQQSDMPFWSHQPNRRIGGIASSANGLLSRLPLHEVLDYPLPGRLPGRGVLIARMGHGNDGLTVAVAHLSLGARSRRVQAAYLAELLSEYPNVVLMGDFNCPPDAPELECLYRDTHLQPPAWSQPTFPSWKPQRPLDHILTSLRTAEPAPRVLPAAGSDHLAVALSLRVPESALQGSAISARR